MPRRPYLLVVALSALSGCSGPNMADGGGDGPIATDARDSISTPSDVVDVVDVADIVTVHDGDGIDVTPIDVVQRDVAPIDVVSEDTGRACALAESYSYDYEGGLTVSMDVSSLTPTNGWHRVRTLDESQLSCSVAIPACGSDAGIDLGAVLDAIADPDVQAALAMSGMPIFGMDPRPVDGQIWAFRRADGRGFFVGVQCNGSDDACVPIPIGIGRLEALLMALDNQQLMDPSCAALQ